MLKSKVGLKVWDKDGIIKWAESSKIQTYWHLNLT